MKKAQSPTKVGVIDFDDLFADTDNEAAAMEQHLLILLSSLTGESERELHHEARRLKRSVKREADDHGYEYGDAVVASAAAGPTFFLMTFAQTVIRNRLGTMSPRAQHSLVRFLMRLALKQVRTVYRSHAAEVLSQLPERSTIVLTDGSDLMLKAKLKGAGADQLVDRVLGNVDKLALGEMPVGVSDCKRVDDLVRPIYLLRSDYWSVLDDVRRQRCASWNQVAVVGRTVETDLALPQALGARVALVDNAHTRPWERAWAQRHGRVLTDIREIPAFFAGT